jgi:hypothetical protein
VIHFDPVPEPPEFDAQVRQPGNAWLREHPRATRPRDFWSPFKAHLAAGFRQLCGYSVMFEPVGTVDHYLSWQHYPEQTYEWANFRFVSGWINSSKQAIDDQVLDPFLVEDGWFAILLPSLQLVITDAVPANERARAEFTLQRLHLRDDERIIRQRQVWYQSYLEGKLSFEGLTQFAPLIAQAVRQQQKHTPDAAPPAAAAPDDGAEHR